MLPLWAPTNCHYKKNYLRKKQFKKNMEIKECKDVIATVKTVFCSITSLKHDAIFTDFKLQF